MKEVRTDKPRDRDLTLEQNYKNLGLSTKLNASISGPRKIKGKATNESVRHDSLGIAANKFQRGSKLAEVRVERDPETGHILRIIDEELEDDNPLDDPLNELTDDDESMAQNHVVAQLEAQAEAEALVEAKKKKPRQQSTRESEWIESLVAKHGADVGAMVRDKKLNPMQQSEGDVSKRLKKWKAKQQG